MSMNRRRFMVSAAGLSLCAALPMVAKNNGNVHYISARSDMNGRHFISSFDDRGELWFSVLLPGRGHAVAVSPVGKEVVAVARRPGRYLIVMDAETGEVLHRLESRTDRHLYGHGIFSPDGRWFYTPENDFANGKGVIGVRDAQQGYRQIRELSSYDAGPHELAMLSDGLTLVVANGGIQTHPDTGRAKLNLESMKPSLAYIDGHSGELLEQQFLSDKLHKNSIRHLTVAPDDQVCCVMQYQGKRTEQPPLIGLHRRGEAIHLLRAPVDIQKRMRNYCGSACVDQPGKVYAVSSPRGGLVTFWGAAGGNYLGHADVADGCGIIASGEPGEFLLSSGQGGVYRYQLAGKVMRQIPIDSNSGFHWDNHMARV